MKKDYLSSETKHQHVTQDVKYTLIGDRQTKFTIELANQMINLPSFEGERALDGKWVDELVSRAKRGVWLPERADISTCIVETDGIERRLNGQHTCWMRTYLPEDWGAQIRVLKYRVPTENDMRLLYSNFDRSKGRTNHHITAARLIGTVEFRNATVGMIAALKYGLQSWLWESTKDRGDHTVDEIATLMQTQYHAICMKAMHILEETGTIKGKTEHMRRAPVFAAIFATANKHDNDALTFWRAVATGLGFTNADQYDGRYKIREYLNKTSCTTGGNKKCKKELVASEDMFRCCIKCWNAWRTGTPIKLLQPGDKRIALK